MNAHNRANRAEGGGHDHRASGPKNPVRHSSPAQDDAEYDCPDEEGALARCTERCASCPALPIGTSTYESAESTYGSSQLREATTTTIMLAVMPIESATESTMILASFHFDIARPTKCHPARRERSGRRRACNDACGSPGIPKKSERRTPWRKRASTDAGTPHDHRSPHAIAVQALRRSGRVVARAWLARLSLPQRSELSDKWFGPQFVERSVAASGEGRRPHDRANGGSWASVSRLH